MHIYVYTYAYTVYTHIIYYDILYNMCIFYTSQYINILIFLLGLGCRHSMQMTVSNGALKVFTCSRDEKD